MGLYAKLAKIMGEITPIEKGGTNAHFKYKFVTADAVADMVRTLLSENGVAFVASTIHKELVTVESFKTNTDRNGEITSKTHNQDMRWAVDYKFSFIDSETNEREDCTWSAEAPANDDKGLNKAATAAEKYFLLKTFVVATADELDTDREDGRGNRKSQQQNKVAGNINAQSHTSGKQLGDLDWTAREGEDNVQAITTASVEVRKAKNGKPFLSFTNGNVTAHAFTRDPLRSLFTEEELAPLTDVGTYELSKRLKVVFVTENGSDGKPRNKVVRIEAA